MGARDGGAEGWRHAWRAIRWLRLRDFGQSVWCDDIGRDFLLAGRLKALIEEDGVSGVTSNPTIFHKAITESTSYDQAVADLASGRGDRPWRSWKP